MLSVRLKAIADCVPEGTIVADIGTDHAFLPVELIALSLIHILIFVLILNLTVKLLSRRLQKSFR